MPGRDFPDRSPRKTNDTHGIRTGSVCARRRRQGFRPCPKDGGQDTDRPGTAAKGFSCPTGRRAKQHATQGMRAGSVYARRRRQGFRLCLKDAGQDADRPDTAAKGFPCPAGKRAKKHATQSMRAGSSGAGHRRHKVLVPPRESCGEHTIHTVTGVLPARTAFPAFFFATDDDGLPEIN